MSAAVILDRLAKTKQTAPGRWLACCPAHEDRSPSLSVRELDDGRVLIHCFGGCGAGDVVASLGLTMSDLFPKRLPGKGPSYTYPKSHSRIPARDLLEGIAEEVAVVSNIAAAMANKAGISDEDWQRFLNAGRRIQAARDHLHV